MAETGILKRYLKVKEVADLLGLSRHTIYRMIQTQTIPFVTFGSIKRFDREEIEKWVKGRSIEGKT